MKDFLYAIFIRIAKGPTKILSFLSKIKGYVSIKCINSGNIIYPDRSVDFKCKLQIGSFR